MIPNLCGMCTEEAAPENIKLWVVMVNCGQVDTRGLQWQWDASLVSRAPMILPGGQWSSGPATSHNIYYKTKSQGVKMKLAIETEGMLSRSLSIFRTPDLDTALHHLTSARVNAREY